MHPKGVWSAEKKKKKKGSEGEEGRDERVALVLLAWATTPWASESESESESKRVSQAGVDSMVESEEE
jgi:hypothetical protein